MSAEGDRYRVMRLLGRGRHAVVHAAFDTRLGRTVALKRADGPGADTALRAEAQRLARVHSPHVVAIHDVLDGPPTTLVLEWLDGSTLRERLHAGRLPLGSAVPWVRQLLTGVAALHDADLAHGDLKPENVWIGTDGTLRLLDVGTGEDATPLYAAPEIGAGTPPSVAGDLYACATIAWEMLAGRLPFDATDAAELAVRKRTRVAPALASAGVTVDAAVEHWLECALAIEPVRREATAATLLEQWVQATAGSTGGTSPRIDLHPRATARLQALTASVQSREGGLVVLRGDPGAGKSTLLEQACADVRAAGGIVITVRRAVAAPRRRFVDWHVAVRRAVRTHPVLPARMLFVPQAAANELAVQERIVATLRAIAAQHPVLVTGDAPAQCDAATRRLLLRLASATATSGFAVAIAHDRVAAGRAAAFCDAALDAMAGDAVELQQPAESAFATFVAAQLGVPSASDALLAHLRARCASNPRLTVAVLRALRDTGALQEVAGAWAFRPERVAEGFPAAAQSVLERGVRGIDPTQRRILEIAAVRGRTFEVETVARVAGRTAPDVEQMLHVLERRSGVVRRDGAIWRFVPALLAESLTERHAPARRADLHRRFASAVAALAPDDTAAIGIHLDEGGDSQAALPYLERAAHTALQRGDAEQAAACAERAARAVDRALDSEDAVRRRVELGLVRAQALHAMAAWDEAATELDHILMLSRAWGLDPETVRALRARGRIEYARSQYDEAIACYRTARECAQGLGDEIESQEIALQIGNIHFERGMLDEALLAYAGVLGWAETHDQDELGARAANNVALVESLQGRKQVAVKYFNRSRERFVALGRDDAVARIDQNIGQIYLELRNWAEARNFFRRAIEAAERTHEDALLAVSCLDFAEATLRLGADDEAVPAIERALAIARERGDAVGIANAQRLQAQRAAAANDLATAEALLVDAIEKLAAVGEALHLALCWKDVGAVRLQAGRTAAARQALDEASRRFASLDAPQHAAEVELLRSRCGEESACPP